jgi:hypothetical protein
MFEPTYWHRACRAIALFSLALLFTSIDFEACAQTTRDHRDAEVEFSIATRDRLQGVIKRGGVGLRFDSQKKGDSVFLDVRTLTGSQIVLTRIMLPPDLPCLLRAQRSPARRQTTAAASLWPHPMAPASKRRALPRSSGSRAWLWDVSARRSRSARTSEGRRRDCGPGTGFDSVPRSPLNSVQMPAKVNSGRSSLSANHTTSFFLVTGFGSGAYSEKLLAGTRHRFSGFSQPRQLGERKVDPAVEGAARKNGYIDRVAQESGVLL